MKTLPMLRVSGVLAASLALLSMPAITARADSPLVGRVLDPEGHPVSRARVFIYTASVRTGTSAFCPSCYPDCRKSADSDGQGRFTIPALSDSLRFRVLVVARGWDPVFVERVDPVAGPVEFKLAQRRAEKTDPHHSLHGRVVDPLGHPVVGATLSPFGYYKETGQDHYMMRFGPSAGTDPLCVTDQEGRFSLALGDSGVGWYITVRGRDLAPLLLSRQPAGATPITVRMRHGATVTGRLLAQGRPLPGVVVGLVQAQRGSQFMAYGHDEIATDERGVFTFVNVTPGEDYLLHGKMESLQAFGALDTTRVHAPADEGLTEVGNLSLGPGRRVSGQVVLSDDKPVPPGTRLLLTLDNAFDAQNQTLDADGRFDLHGVPPGDATLFVRLRGYRFARASAGYTEAPGIPACAISGDQDVQGLSLILEPGEPQPETVVRPAPKP